MTNTTRRSLTKSLLKQSLKTAGVGSITPLEVAFEQRTCNVSRFNGQLALPAAFSDIDTVRSKEPCVILGRRRHTNATREF